METAKWIDETRKVINKGEEVYASIDTGRITIIVHRHTYYPADIWLLSTVPAFYDKKRLINKDLCEAKKEALSLVQEELKTIITEIEKASN